MPARVCPQDVRANLGSRWLALLLLLIATGVRAYAAPPPIEITNIDWGFDGSLAAERWNPVTLWVQSRERPFSGMLTVTFTQDATQKAAISLPVATTPGSPTPVELCLAIPRHCEKIDFEFTGDRARTAYTARPTPRRADDLQLPQAVGRLHTVVVLGELALRDAFHEPDPTDPNVGVLTPRTGTIVVTPSGIGQVTLSSSGSDPAVAPPLAFPWSSFYPAKVQPQRLPRAWMAYDAADAVVVPAELGIADGINLDPRAIDTLRTWVASGGRLVLLAHDAGDGWTRWFPDALGGLPIALGDRARVSIPSDVIPDDDKRSPTATARPIRLSPIGSAHAWSLRWKLDEGSALIAEGPMGFGWITVISIDATQAARSGEFAPRQVAWRNALMPALQPVVDRERNAMSANNAGRFDDWWLGSAPDHETSIAQRVVLDHLVQVPPFAHTAFMVIAACVILLALMLGPGDFFLLKRFQKRQFAWLSALFWVSLASAIAYIIPGAVRQTESRLDRFVVRDVLLPESKAAAPIEASSAITTLFAGKISRPRFPETPVGSWWRGISPIAAYQKLGGQSALACFQGAPDLTAPKGTLPIATSLNQWTLRGYLDHQPAGPAGDPITATLHKIDAEWDVTISGLPATTKILDARLRAFDGEWERWWDMRTGSPTERRLQSTPAKSSSALSELPDWRGLDPSKNVNMPWMDPGHYSHGSALRLPGARDREPAIATLVASRRFACLYLHVQELNPTIQLTSFPAHEQGIVRILIPIQP